ncbi:MAG: beta-N-acetylhexosaminidase [Akkermansia sp.]|nr:beta-N-acetylhexosaminidase [Akkermansia sp.]
MKSRLLVLTALLSAGITGAAPSAPVTISPAIIPQPQSMQVSPGQPGFCLKNGIKVHYKVSRSELGSAAVRALMAAGLPVLPEENTGELTVEIVPHDNPEWHSIRVSPEGIELKIASEKALPAAAQTLAQSVVKSADGSPALPCMQVQDAPLLPYRGLMLDPCRHPLTVDETRKMLRLMARYKLNRLHWHLADDQGWRIEIKSYPRLTEVGSHRAETPTLANHEIGDGKPTAPFYFTQEQVRDIVAYANNLGITVIPEIEVPGHSSAAIAAYPELGNSDIPGYAPRVATTWGVLPYTDSPKPETMQFLERVFAEVCELVPRAEFIHIGGAEAPRDQWQHSPYVQQFMQQQGMRHAGQVQHWFTHRMAELLARHDRRLVGWDEIIDDGAVPANAVVMYWRSWVRPCSLKRALSSGHDVIQSPDSHFYFNFCQGKLPDDPRYKPHGSLTAEQDWRHVYSYNPIPADISPEQRRHLIGLQANCWSESIADGHKLEYQCVPRICALAEVAWRPAELRNADEFLQRVLAHYPWFDEQNINYRREDGSPAGKGGI